MKQIAALLLSSGLLFGANALAQPIEIKGLRIGMTRSDVAALHPKLPGFTVAGVASKFPNIGISLDYKDEALDEATFFFAADHFETILAAFKQKYAALNCSTSSVGNAMGAKFTQVDCKLRDPASALSLVKYVDLRTSVLSIRSSQSIEADSKKAAERKKDI